MTILLISSLNDTKWIVTRSLLDPSNGGKNGEMGDSVSVPSVADSLDEPLAETRALVGRDGWSGCGPDSTVSDPGGLAGSG